MKRLESATEELKNTRERFHEAERMEAQSREKVNQLETKVDDLVAKLNDKSMQIVTLQKLNASADVGEQKGLIAVENADLVKLEEENRDLRSQVEEWKVKSLQGLNFEHEDRSKDFETLWKDLEESKKQQESLEKELTEANLKLQVRLNFFLGKGRPIN